jgi:succinylarginine dihydrolase
MSPIVNDSIQEVIFVGMPGPTHHYSGLSVDNVASSINRGNISNPRQAALQGLDLVRLLTSLGITAAILPPQLRPHLPLLRYHFSGNDESVILQAARKSEGLLESASSSSAMWVANAATATPGIDAKDGKLHLTTANLFTNVHRRIEAEDTHRVLSAIFADVPDSIVHAPLSAAAGLKDEGAANHMRLSPSQDELGLHIFVYGSDGRSRDPETARQTISASRAVKALHGISDAQALFMRQNPAVIEQGVFHNDVIAVSNENLLLVHEKAYDGESHSMEVIEHAYAELHPGRKLNIIMIGEKDLSVSEAVHTYFFNSQIVSKRGGGMALIAPIEVKELYGGKAASIMERICAARDNPIEEMHFIDLRQSMRNGGGPACLRMRVPMTDVQRLALAGGAANVVASDALLEGIEGIIESFYPERLYPSDVGNPDLYHCCQHVLGEMEKLMRLPLLSGASGTLASAAPMA